MFYSTVTLFTAETIYRNVNEIYSSTASKLPIGYEKVFGINIPPHNRAGGYAILWGSVAASAAASSSAVAEEEEYETDSYYDPNVFAIKKVTQAVHTKPPFRVSYYSFTLILLYACAINLRVGRGSSIWCVLQNKEVHNQ